MKKYSWLFVFAFMAYACQLQNEEIVVSDNASGHHTNGNYQISSSSSDGYTWTIVIDQSGQHAISHMNFSGTFCDGSEITAANVLAVTVNSQNWQDYVAGSTGNADDCGATKLKLDEFNFSGVVTIDITFDSKVANGAFLIKAGNNCYGANNSNFQFTYNCDPEPCFEEKHETAWAAGQRYVLRGNWATVTPYAEGTVNVYAGQHHHAGTATFSAVSNGKVTISITLFEGWSLDGVSNTVKIQDYATKPSGNPSPGRFAHKGTSLTVEVPANNFYGIHLDVVHKRQVDCPN